MTYLTLAVPAELAPVANSIAMAFEPDSGIDPSTYSAFSTVCKDLLIGDDYVAYGTEVADWLADAVFSWKDGNSEALWQAVQTTYADRWPELTAPSLEDCTEFTQQVLISTQYGLIAGLYELGMELLHSAEPQHLSDASKYS